ncbi:PAS and helix-turn-helix domain-containing protein [Desulfogranum japonicum]|uniref:PAS and helix-turn-helix domain-containing protein n=1 Tax=Desulfogranum japonicum TaxID=231447 RepID=UPI000412E65A|nr:PAS and helix-turn-helix domain-containing protein [Desulfogranum japonicum]
MSAQDMYKVIVNSLATHVAVLDNQGIIIETNRSWQEFAKSNGMVGPIDCVGLNYLRICESAPDDASNSRYIARAIRQVIVGEISEFLTQYPCHSPTEKRWFSLRIVPYQKSGENKVLVTHDNITPIILAQEKLKQQEAELKAKTNALEETNIALKVLLEHRDKDKQEMEDRFVANIQELVLPYLEKLHGTNLDSRSSNLLDIAENHLQDVLSPFLKRLSALNLILTPQELEVATMVRQGKSSQDIADMLNVSVATVSFHRKKLRHKLGISKTGTNLRTYLLSLQ